MSTRRLRLVLAMAAGVFVVATAVAACDDGSTEPEARAPSAGPSADEQGAAASGEEAPASDERFRTRVRPEEVPAGTSTDVELAIEPKEGLKINLEYPSWTLEIEEAEGVEFASQSFDRDDFDLQESGATVSTKVTVPEQGARQWTGRADFSVCNDETCHILRDEAVAFRVEATGEGGSAERSNGE